MTEAARKINEKNTRIGHITEVGGDAFVAQLVSEDQGYEPEIMIGQDKIRIGQVGSYLLVKQAGLSSLVMVDSQWQETDVDDDTVRFVRLTPLGEFTEKGSFERGVAHFPTTGAELHLVPIALLSGVFAKFSKAGYQVGRLSAFDNVDVCLDASSFFGRHSAILGQTGAGKSWSVTSLIQSALKAMPNAHVIMLDLHGEYGAKRSDPLSRTPFPKDKVRCIDAEELEIPYWLLTFADLVELLVDPEDEDSSIQIAFLRGSVLELKREANEHMDIGHITVDSPIYFPMEELYRRIKTANETLADFGKSKTALSGKFDQLMVRLQSRLNDNRYDFLLRPKKRTSSETLSDLMRDFVGLGTPRAKVTVVDISAVPVDVQTTVTAQIGRLAFEFNFWNPRCHEFPLWLVCEEAHAYIPRIDDPRHRETRRVMERIAKAGRKYGVGLCVITQRPHELSETVLSQCGTFICLRISNPDDQEYVRTLVPDAARGMLDAITSLARGEAVAMGEAVPMPVRFRITLPDPPPHSSDVDYGSEWLHGPEEINVDELVQNWRRQER